MSQYYYFDNLTLVVRLPGVPGSPRRTRRRLPGIPGSKGVFKGGVQTPPPKFSDFYLKSEGKEIERKRKKGMLGEGGLPLNIFWGWYFFEWS